MADGTSHFALAIEYTDRTELVLRRAKRFFLIFSAAIVISITNSFIVLIRSIHVSDLNFGALEISSTGAIGDCLDLGAAGLVIKEWKRPASGNLTSLRRGRCGRNPRHIASRPEAHGKGYGTAMTLAIAQAGRARGYLFGVLYATTADYGVYRRLGFQEYCRIDIYKSPE